MGHSDLKKLIDDYDNGLISEESLVETLKVWDYVPQDSNSSPWECDAQYVEGSWDDVELAYDRGVIPESVYSDVLDYFLIGDDDAEA